MNPLSNSSETPTKDLGRAQKPVSDEVMQRLLGSTAPSIAFLIRKGPAWEDAATQPLQWEHARNMFTLVRDGRLRYVCPLLDGTDVLGFGVLNVSSKSEAEALLKEDPAVRGGRVTFQVLTGAEFRENEVAF